MTPPWQSGANFCKILKMFTPVLLFDFGGTLDAPGIPWLDRFYPIYRAQNIYVSRESFAQAFHDSDNELNTRHRLAGASLDKTLRLQVQGVLERIAPERLKDSAAISRRFLTESREYIRQIKPLLERLHQSHPLAVVSNFYGNLDSVLESEGLLNLFEVVSDSGAIGCMKPEPGIFLHALRALGVKPQDSWMVGDSLERDMRGAESLGMRHAWLQGQRQKRSSCCPKGLVLESLKELEPLLAKSECGSAP